jgi:4-hydroxy-tetrahydrodipicolinate reductase
MIKTSVIGADGRMGIAICDAISQDAELELVTRFTRRNVDELQAASVDVVIDVTNAAAAVVNLPKVAEMGAHVVVGTSGLTQEAVAELDGLFRARDARCLIVPNFAIAAVLQMRFAALAAPYFDTVVLEERHHMKKIDAPSGLSRATAELIADARGDFPWAADPTQEESVPGVRGGDVRGIRVHSVRSPGVMARQEVAYGAQGQSLTITYDSLDRSSFMPGVVLAVKEVASLPPGVTVGLDAVLGF